MIKTSGRIVVKRVLDFQIPSFEYKPSFIFFDKLKDIYSSAVSTVTEPTKTILPN
ncbi:MAG TPA: hypothetical protein PL041_07350 [Melioribacteraceae bacterium]|nr:hypothetical protein [Melioribacteraceae bacterium]